MDEVMPTEPGWWWRRTPQGCDEAMERRYGNDAMADIVDAAAGLKAGVRWLWTDTAAALRALAAGEVSDG